MTEQPAATPPAGKAPAAPDPRARAEQLRAQLAEAEAAVPAPAGTVKVRVMPPHDSFTRGGVTVGRDFTPVPAGLLPELISAADGAGVTLEEANGA